MKKRILSVLLALVMTMAFVPMTVMADSSGDGTESSPRVVSTEEELVNALNAAPEGNETYYISLLNDIPLTTILMIPENKVIYLDGDDYDLYRDSSMTTNSFGWLVDIWGILLQKTLLLMQDVAINRKSIVLHMYMAAIGQ